MKATLFAAIVVVAIAAVSAESCKDSSECKDGECCTGVMPFRGQCKPMSKEGAMCLVDKRTFSFTGKELYIFTCPCEKGCECIRNEKGKSKKKDSNNGKCTVATTVAPETTTPLLEVTTEGDNNGSGDSGEQTEGPSREVTEGPSGEVTEGPNGEVTEGPSGEVTEGPNGEVTEGNGSNEVTTFESST